MLSFFLAQKELIESAKRFSKLWQEEDILQAIGRKTFIKLYGGKGSDSLGTLRLVVKFLFHARCLWLVIYAELGEKRFAKFYVKKQTDYRVFKAIVRHIERKNYLWCCFITLYLL